MAAIYHSATQVVIFLGDEVEGTEKAVQLLLDIGNKDMHIPDLVNGIDASDQAQTVSRLTTLLQCAWFSRVWTIQESLMARSAVVQRARYTVPWDELGRAAQGFQNLECCELYLQTITHSSKCL